jgi:hypothetical protein
MDLCLAPRTLVLKGQTAYLEAGAGQIHDPRDPDGHSGRLVDISPLTAAGIIRKSLKVCQPLDDQHP